MADERLRLVAEVQDQFTGPLDKLNTALRRTATAGSKTAKDIAKDFEGFHGTLGKTTATLQGMLSPLQSLGVAGLGAGLGLSGIATALRSFSSGTQQLSILSKESGLAVNQLRALSQLGDRFGVSAETMNSGVIHLSEGMRKLKMGYGELQTSLLALNKGEFADKLFNAKDMQEALDSAMEELSKEKDSYKRRQLAEVIFGTKDFGVIAGQVAGKYREVMQEIIASQGVMTKETEKAAAEFEKNMSRMGSAAERLKLNTLGPLLKGLNTIVESGDRNGIRGNAEAMDKDLATRLTDATKRRDELSSDPTKNADEIKSLEKEIRTLTDAIRRSKEGAGPSGVSAIPMSYSGGMGGGGARIYTASLGGGGGFGGGNAATLGGFGGPLPTLGGGYGGGLGGGGSDSGGGRSGGSYAPPLSQDGGVPSPVGNYTGNDGRRAARGRASAQGRENVASWMEFLQRPVGEGGLGMPRGKAQATIAMMQGESGLNLDSGISGDSGHAHGTAQWSDQRGNPRFPLLRRFAESQGKPWQDRGVQQQYLRMEMLGLPGAVSHRRAYDAMMRAPTDEHALREGIAKFENPQKHDLAYAIRVPFLNRLRRDGGTAPVAEPSAPAGTRHGDAMMRRLYGDQAPVARGGGKGTMDITLHGFPAGAKARVSMDDLFKDVTVSKSRQLDTTNI